jgi:hypothetical protein
MFMAGIDLTIDDVVNVNAVVPLPSAAWAGLGLLDIIGTVRRSRRRSAS